MYNYNQPKKIDMNFVKDGAYRGGEAFSALNRSHGLFYVHGSLPGLVNSSSKIFASISEVGIFDDQVKPFLGAANMMILNVVPMDNSEVLVRCYIDWNEDLDFQVSIVVF
ncbi:hypothetical protein [Bacillus salipaludis]|uniref:hypothetical protein n=1 Tax=Bacillus salipaludis TaxID=2547811 RepID=UPI002E1C4A86|nr:hypothetical protein [Bacillus salipaludis]